MPTANRIITEAKKCLNIPFCHFGRSNIGVDCAGLIWLAYTRCGIEMVRVDRAYGPFWWRDPSQGERLLNGLKNEWGFEICDSPVVGGLVLFRLYGKNVPANHCGITLNQSEFIHAKCGIGKRKVNRVSIDNLYPGYYKRLACFMKHREINYE